MCDDQSVLPCWHWNNYQEGEQKPWSTYTVGIPWTCMGVGWVIPLLFKVFNTALGNFISYTGDKINNSFEIKTEQSFFVLCRPQSKKL